MYFIHSWFGIESIILLNVERSTLWPLARMHSICFITVSYLGYSQIRLTMSEVGCFFLCIDKVRVALKLIKIVSLIIIWTLNVFRHRCYSCVRALYFHLSHARHFLYSLSSRSKWRKFYEFSENVQRLLNEINNKHNYVGFAFFNLWHLIYKYRWYRRIGE